MIFWVATGFNSTLRLGNVTHHEYVQVGFFGLYEILILQFCGLINHFGVWELSFNCTGLLVGCPLFLYPTLFMSGGFLMHSQSWCGGLNKGFLYWFREGQTHFGIEGANMSLALIEPKWIALHSNSGTTLTMHHKLNKSIDIVQEKTNRISCSTN